MITTNAFFSLVARHTDAQTQPISHTMVNLIIALLILLICALLLVAGLLFMRRRRRARKVEELLPMYNDKHLSTASIVSSTTSHRRIMVRPRESITVYQQPTKYAAESDAPSSPIPEIRITFPEEVDAHGKRQSGRVVVVRVGDTTVGLEPVSESLPAYHDEDRGFQSLDLETIGGLVEKPRSYHQ